MAVEGGCRDSCFGGPSTMVCVADYYSGGDGREAAPRGQIVRGGREGALCRRGAPPGALRRRERARRSAAANRLLHSTRIYVSTT